MEAVFEAEKFELVWQLAMAPLGVFKGAGLNTGIWCEHNLVPYIFYFPYQ